MAWKTVEWGRGFRRRVLSRFMRYRHRLWRVDPSAQIFWGCRISSDLVAGAYTSIGPGCQIGPGIMIGPYVLIAANVSFVGSDHRIDRPGMPIIFSGRPAFQHTVVDADCWIGTNAIIMSGVHINRGAVVAAGAVVTKDINAYDIVGGIPAIKIGERFPDKNDRIKHDEMLNRPTRTGEYCQPLKANG